MNVRAALCVLIFFITAAASVTGLGPYVNEDYEKIEANSGFLLSGSLASKMFVEEAGFERLYYRPLNNLAMSAMARMWGTTGRAGRFRTVAALAFALAILAFFVAGVRLGLPPAWALGASAVFALHPFNAWSYFQASWIGNALVIPLLALAFWAWERSQKSAAWAVALGLIVYAACLARDSAGLFVLMLIPLAVWSPRRGRAAAAWAAAAAGALAYFVQRAYVIDDSAGVLNAGRLRESLENAGGAAMQYAACWVAGINRNFVRPITPVGGWLLTFAVAAAIAAGLWALRRNRTAFFIAWCAAIALFETAFSLWISPVMAPSRVTVFGIFVLLGAARLAWKYRSRGGMWIGIVILWYGFQSVSHVYASLDSGRFYKFHNDPPYNWKTLFTEGREYHDRKEWDAAVRSYAASLAVSSRAVTHFDLALALMQRGEPSDRGEALRHFREAVMLDPAEAEYHTALATALEDAGDTATAGAHFFKAVEIDPSLEAAYAGIGRCYVATRDGSPSADPGDFYPGLRNSAAFYGSLGMLYARAGRLDDAERYLKRALEITPHAPRALSNLGMLHMQRGQLKEAVVYFERAVVTEPGYERARLNLGLALAKQGKTAEAVAHFREALDRNPASAEAARYLKASEGGAT